MSQQQKTVIITGASQGIGAAAAKAFLARGYNVVGTSRNISKSTELTASERLLLVDGDIGDAATAARVVAAAVQRFGGVDALVNNAGIFMAKPFTDFTADDFKNLVHTNLEGYLYITQQVVKQFLAQKRGGNSSVSMMTKGGIAGGTSNLAIEYAKDHIRFNLVAPGIVDTPMHKDDPKDFLKTLSPMGTISSAEQIADGIVSLTEAQQVTGEVLHMGGGSQRGRG